MSKIYRTSDRIPITVGSIVVTISPMSFDQKVELQGLMLSAKDDPLFAVKAARLSVKRSVKDVSGLEDMYGEEYVCARDDNGQLTDDTVDDLLNIEESTALVTMCAQLINGIPKGFVDPITKAPIKGVSIESTGKKPKARGKAQSGS